MRYSKTIFQIATATFVLLFAAFVNAQTAARPDRGVQSSGSYSVSDIENINLTTGNLNLSIPLAGLPPIAGGKLAFTLNATYNSKLWDVTRSHVKQNEAPVYDYIVDTPQLTQTGNWSVYGSKLNSLEVHTVRTATGEVFPRCANCRITTAGTTVTSDPK